MKGIGVMLKELGGNAISAESFSAAIGKTISRVTREGDSICLRFDDGTGIALSDEGQSCCEDRHMTCDDDLASFAGAKLIGGEIADAPSTDHAGWGVHEVQFLRLHTDRGDLVCQTHNIHNGYYGGFAVRCRELAS